MADRNAEIAKKLLAEAEECEATAQHSTHSEMRDHFNNMAANLRRRAAALTRT